VADRDRRHPDQPAARRDALKPGSATLPLPGVKPLLVDAEGKELDGATEGNLCIADSWPGQMRTVFGDHERFIQTYFSTFPACISPATAPARRGRLLLDHRPRG
jgi:acyl-coenzyme A synthetase/AMP-(fatty) acid ligase